MLEYCRRANQGLLASGVVDIIKREVLIGNYSGFWLKEKVEKPNIGLKNINNLLPRIIR